jgi:Xaa-Pro aminopeptidase
VAPLSQAVRDRRWEALRGVLDAQGLGAVVLTSPDYIEFATNFEVDVLGWERPIAVVLPREGEPFGLLHELSGTHIATAQRTGALWLDDITVYAEHPRVTPRLPLLPQWPQAFADLLRGHGLGRGRIGVDAWTRPLRQAIALLPYLAGVEVDRALRTTRAVKSTEELELVRQAAALSDWAQERYREEIHPNRLVEELDCTVAAAVAIRAAAVHPDDGVRVRALTFAGPASVAPHGTGARTAQVVDASWPIINIVVVRLNGMTIENERTWFCSAPSEMQGRAFEAAVLAQDAAVRELRTGHPVAAFDAAAFRAFVDAGLDEYVVHRTGHGVGLGHGGSITAHDFPDDTAFETRPLMTGEVYSAEPGIYIPGVGGFRHDDTVIVGPEPEVVTRAPRSIEAQTLG